MLEKLAEMVREERGVDGLQDIPCCACDYFGTSKCRDAAHCPDYTDDNGSLMLARWAVLLVARGLENEIERLSLFRGLSPSEAAMEAAARLGASIYNLIAEAKEGGGGASIRGYGTS